MRVWSRTPVIRPRIIFEFNTKKTCKKKNAYCAQVNDQIDFIAITEWANRSYANRLTLAKCYLIELRLSHLPSFKIKLIYFQPSWKTRIHIISHSRACNQPNTHSFANLNSKIPKETEATEEKKIRFLAVPT